MFKKLVLCFMMLAVVIFSHSQPVMADEKIIKIDGSSTVYPITEAVAEEYQKAKKGAVKVTVGISGTGGGFKGSAGVKQTSLMLRDPLRTLKSRHARNRESNSSNSRLHTTASRSS